MNHNQLHSALEKDAINLRLKSKSTNKEQVEASDTFVLFIKMDVKLNLRALKKS